MLSNVRAIATVAVRNLDTARSFYEEKLGLSLAEGHQEPGTATYRTGGTTLLVYPSSYAGTNQATAVTWDVGEGIAELVRTLRGKGLAFEHYDMPGTRLEGDLHVSDGLKVAWFKDLDGNIHALVGN